MNKVVSLQTEVDKSSDFCETVNQMLKDTYYMFWKQGNLQWMDDYPQVMAGIHARLIEETKAAVAQEEGVVYDVGMVNRQFTVEETKAIAKGYELLAENEDDEDGLDIEGLGEPHNLTAGMSSGQAGPQRVLMRCCNSRASLSSGLSFRRTWPEGVGRVTRVSLLFSL